MYTDLHRNQSVVDEDFFGKEIGTYCGFVGSAELLVDILVHQAGFANTRIAEYLRAG